MISKFHVGDTLRVLDQSTKSKRLFADVQKFRRADLIGEILTVKRVTSSAVTGQPLYIFEEHLPGLSEHRGIVEEFLELAPVPECNLPENMLL
ncbi:MAG: hypothetical protein IJV14_10785 [Lachnospiraceae bacterium]|nr:hypothetical protein [Lachnospiraceae bacterium]